ncbi:lysophospholipid acyltransferase family protein [Lignipirellula cremea]|uniref:Acyltransferase n=1 Tax=Lignipirellula cremea TaxID=2528010 RepID=A0A518DRV1_9BACT|nr:lysophospholipid acyltransferase family protein [Lignipirellula cremea]QDU94561.1 Acyltransferase [Lignipirellula cremea]
MLQELPACFSGSKPQAPPPHQGRPIARLPELETPISPPSDMIVIESPRLPPVEIAPPQALYGTILKALGPAVRTYSRVEVRGLEHLPAGRALLAANHPGSLWWDAFCLAASMPERQIHFVAQEWDAETPLIGRFLRSTGCHFQRRSLTDVDIFDPVVAALQEEKLLAAFPEQAYHTWRSRRVLHRFSPHVAKYAALAEAPIIPCAVIGAEWAAATLTGWKRPGMPFHFPWAPPILLPLKIVIEFGPPATYAELLNEEPNSRGGECLYQHAADRLQVRVADLIGRHRPCEISREFYLNASSWW